MKAGKILTGLDMSTHYPVIIIGSGQAGGPLAQAFAKAGTRTALIESTHVGGTCVNEGCTPTKTMVASARVAYLASRAESYGVRLKRSSVTVNMETVRRRKREMVDSFRSGGESRITGTENLDLLMGKARFVEEKKIELVMNETKEVRILSAGQVFINTGCSPAKLAVQNVDQITGHVLNSTTIMELEEVPKHLIVVGGGYVGVEFAQMFRRFGARVSLVQRGRQLLANEDPDVAEAVKDILVEGGIDVYLEAKTNFVHNVTLGQIVLQLSFPDGSVKSLLASHLLGAAGRVPNTPDLGLASAGVEVDHRGFVKVDDHLQTTAPDVYALGDVKGGPQFTHISYDDFRLIRQNLITDVNSNQLRSIKDRLVPYTVFIDPPLGRVGLTEKEARAKYPDRKIKVAKMPMAYVARALETDETKGFMKAIVDGDTKEILGFACLGGEGGEIMSMVQLAMMGGLTYDKLESAIFAHPCWSESLNNLWGFLE